MRITTSRTTPASITAMTVTAITTPDVLLIHGLAAVAAVESSNEHSPAQIIKSMVCPLLRVNGLMPLALICAPSCPALLPLTLTL